MILASASVQATHVEAQTVTIPSGTVAVDLESTGPAGSTTFDVPASTIISSPTDGIDANASQNWTLTNEGTINGGTGGIRMFSAVPNGATVDNFGTITNTGPSSGGTNGGVILASGGTFTNHAGAQINSASDGLYAATAGTSVTNDGSIVTGITGVYFNAGGIFTQGATGTITGTTPGTYGVIGNAGTFSGTNAGSISVTGIAAWFRGATTATFTNSGSLSANVGAELDTSGSSLTNTGTITGTGGNAILISGNNNNLVLGSGSTLNGNAVSSGTGNTLTLQGMGSEDSSLTGFSTLTMSGMTWQLAGGVSTTAGTAAATQIQSGLLILTGALTNGNGGGVTIAAGSLQLGDGGTSGSVTGNVVDNGTLVFDRSDTVTFPGTISGTGAVNQTGTGTTILSANNTYGGGTTIASGTLQIGNGGTTGSIVGSVTDNGILDFDRSDTMTLAGVISGTGSVTQTGTGTTVLTAGNTYAGGTTISAGTLQLGDGGTSGSVAGGIVNNGILIFNRSNELDLASDISGTGSVEQVGAGTTVLTGTNTYTGGTTISNGILRLGDGAASGSLAGDVTDNGQLAFDRSDVVTFNGVITGTGSLTQLGEGTTVLNAVNRYSGGTAVSAGTLAVGDAGHADATLGAGPTTVAAGATLGGYGTVPGQVTNMGMIAAANAVTAFAGDADGTLTITGDLVNQGTANLAAASGQSTNVLAVGGNYTGSNATLMLNTVLNEGGAATKTDQLSIAGNASGDTAIRVHGTGDGAQTVGDGIKLVGVAGSAAANSFRLANAVQGGAFQYLLYEGGATAADNNWYLRSTFEAPSTPTTPQGPVPAGVTVASAVAFRPATVVYSMAPALNAGYGFTALGRLHERVGDLASVEANPQNKDAAPDKDGFWGRVSGEDIDANSSNRFSAQQNTFLAQFGKDWTLARTANGGSTHAGATVTFGSSSATFDDHMRSLVPQLTDAAGSMETQAQSIGGYWTRYLPDGTYFDGVGQLTHYQNKYGDIYGDSASQNGFSAGASAEVGKPFLLGSTPIAIEPQAQLLYQYLHLNAFDDGISPISSTTSNALRGRIGVRLFRANLSNDDGTAAATPYLTADVLHDFFSPGRTTVGGTPFEPGLSRTWYEAGVGVTSSAGRSSELYFNVKYACNIGGQYQRSIFGQAGYRHSW